MTQVQKQNFAPKIVEYRCKRCGRVLKTALGQELGYGKICYQKVTAKNRLGPILTKNISKDG